ncbi:NAD(P)-binding domain-containing protein [Arenibaculum pallidiluteum]|uniref:NAD(P)-binding domain-containing protein n=1 Tax=Arenibaculum pallidiluteum TaxID=2812559 RepID=UPI001A97462C|nr:NAD(P)/FAD-dependent oxidoreductase [Arenibaculum pallidiluteum]
MGPAREDAVTALAERVRRDLDILAYPNVDWVQPAIHRSGLHVHDVVVVGAGQSGLAVALGLRRDGVTNVLVLDRATEGREGPWETFARMDKLRTPRFLVGLEQGIPSLCLRSWYEARYGEDAWLALDRLPRIEWMAYLRWYRGSLGLPVRNETALETVEPDGDVLALRVRSPSGPETLLARRLVLATGYDGGGEWRIPAHIREALPPEVCRHSNTVIDFGRVRGKRVGVLGHGASAFDASLAALRNGAASVDLCFRRAGLPGVNPHRWIEFAGFLKHFPDLDDAVRWRVNHHFDKVDQPPARHSFDAAHAFANFRVHPGAPWTRVAWEDGEVKVETPSGRLAFDEVVCATGSAIDLGHRPELRPFAGEIARWADRYVPPPEEAHPTLEQYPYLGAHYELQPRTAGQASFLERIYAFNFSAIVSMGPHSTSISGHKYSIPRIVAGITRSLFREQAGWLVPALEAYDEVELELPVRDCAPSVALFESPHAAE